MDLMVAVGVVLLRMCVSYAKHISAANGHDFTVSILILSYLSSYVILC